MSKGYNSNRKYGLAGSPRTKLHDKFTNTTPDLMVCQKCREREVEDKTALVKDYIKSINYINSCHNIINEVIKKNSEAPFTMPDIPNFLSIFTFINMSDNKRTVHELDNIESLDEIYSRIDSLDITDDVVIEKKTEDAVNDVKPDQDYSTDDENRRHNRTSSIPRRVKDRCCSGDKTKCRDHDENPEVKHHSLTSQEEDKATNLDFVNSVPTTTISTNMEDFRADISKQSSDDTDIKPEVRISLQDLDKFAKELLGSGSDSPMSSPVESSSCSPKHKRSSNNKISYKTKSEHSLKQTKSKIYSKRRPSTQPNMYNINESNPSITVGIEATNQCVKKTSNLKKPGSPRYPSNSVSQNSSFSKRVSINTDDTSLKLTPNKWDTSDHSVANNVVNYEDSDIEPDDVAELCELRNIINQKTKSSHSTKSESTYVVKQKPIDFFTKRRKVVDEKIAETDSEFESDMKMNKISVNEVDAFESSIGLEVADTSKKINSGLGLKSTPSRILPKSVLSNIGILTQTGKMKPEKEEELEKIKSARSSDKQNAFFRQPRNRSECEDEVLQINDDNISANSSRSSDIKSDDEQELASHRMDMTTKYNYKCHC